MEWEKETFAPINIQDCRQAHSTHGDMETEL
jgi:hypothetical protein